MTKLQKLNQDIEALDKSAKHWDRMATGEDTDDGPDGCTLCGLYHGDPDVKEDTDCLGCPVYEFTKRQYCRGTPQNSYIYTYGISDAEEEAVLLRRLRKNLVAKRRRLLAKGKK